MIVAAEFAINAATNNPEPTPSATAVELLFLFEVVCATEKAKIAEPKSSAKSINHSFPDGIAVAVNIEGACCPYIIASSESAGAPSMNDLITTNASIEPKICAKI